MQTFLASTSDVKRTNCCKSKDEIVSFEVKFDPMAQSPPSGYKQSYTYHTTAASLEQQAYYLSNR